MFKTVKKWSCKNCGHEFYPTPPDFTCPRCHTTVIIPIMDSEPMIIQPPTPESMKSGKYDPSKFKESDYQTELPKYNEPLKCAFMRRFSETRIRCGLTGVGEYGGVVGKVFTSYDACMIDICPLYQSWKLLKK